MAKENKTASICMACGKPYEVDTSKLEPRGVFVQRAYIVHEYMTKCPKCGYVNQINVKAPKEF